MKNSPNKTSKIKSNKKKDSESKQTTKIFLTVCLGLIAGAYFYFSNYEPTPVAEKFYTDRKVDAAPQIPKETGKTKPEKNIFLQ